MKFVLASHNKKKIAEMAAILGELGVEVVPLPEDAPEPAEDGATFEENARIKAVSAAGFTGLPAIADDSGLCVDALGRRAWGSTPRATARGPIGRATTCCCAIWRIRMTAPAVSCARSARYPAGWGNADRARRVRGGSCSVKAMARADLDMTRCSMCRPAAARSANCRRKPKMRYRTAAAL